MQQMPPTGFGFVRSCERWVKSGIKHSLIGCPEDGVLDGIGEGVEGERNYLYIRQARFNHRNGCTNRATGIVNFITIRPRFKRADNDGKLVIAVRVGRKVN